MFAYLVMSAARRPADVTTNVCGLPVFSDAKDNKFRPPVLETYLSRKLDILFRFLGFSQPLVS